MSILMHYTINDILSMKVRHYDGLWKQYIEIQKEASGEGEKPVYDYEVKAMEKLKERYK